MEMRTVLGTNIISQENNYSESRTLAINQRGIAGSNHRRETFWSLENYFTYNKTFNDIHCVEHVSDDTHTQIVFTHTEYIVV